MSELIKRFKSEYMHTKKSLGQHFLTNQHFINEIADAAGLTQSTPVIEIGPGCGVLTEALAARTKKLTAIEIDDNAAAFLEANREEFFPQLNIIHNDVLKVDLSAVYNEPAVIVGNLPYNLSVRIVEHCTQHVASIIGMVFMFQKEVAARIAANPGSKDYSSLSVYCAYHYRINKVRDISGGNFWPNANVYSTVLKFTPIPPALRGADETQFLDMVYKAFRQKRKTLNNNLKELVALPQALEMAGLSQSVRAEELSLAKFLEIFSYIKANHV